MINSRSIRKLNNEDGLTLRKGKKISYKTGYQVADCGVEVHSVKDCMQAVKSYNGDCGVWYYENTYYVDHSFRVATKKKAMELGKLYHQMSIFNWKTGKCEYVK